MYSRLEEVHPSVGALKKLIILDVRDCEKLERLPTMLQSGVEVLNFSGCRSLRKFPEIQQNVNRLTESTSAFEHGNIRGSLDLRGCSNIETLPRSICRLKTLRFLYLNHCTKLKNLPEDVCDLEHLEGVDASETSIWCIPNSITRLEKLKFLSFRKVPKFFHESELCSWGCFAQLDLNFQFPSNLPSGTLTSLDLSACNLVDGSILEYLGWFAALLTLNLSRNSFTYLPKSISLLYSLRFLDITYCEKLKELPELPPRIMELFADDRFALQSIPTLPAMYKELYLVSFANLKLQEMWCNSRRESSGAQMRNCPRENMTEMLEDILLPFLSMVQQKLVFDDPHRGGIFCIAFPRSDPRDEVPSWFMYSAKCAKAMCFNLNKHWYSDTFLGIAIYCQLPFLNDESPKDSSLSFSMFRSVQVTIKLVPDRASIDQQPLEKIIRLSVSRVVACGSFDCFIFFQVDMSKVHRKGKGKDTMVNDPNDYCRFEVSIGPCIPLHLGVHLVYADDSEGDEVEILSV
ncbi:disease resistance protein Roq1-like [Lycium ferocissimum]|uniref:disease resistance protein Roq1-like n=1 Tax=Lycium ferocissimum TaxID=112874 RepID=UPI002815D26C|nr:disease resistance protein Roq1-like [Lycium ferocissimum]